MAPSSAPTLTFPRSHPPEWQPFPSPTSTPNADKSSHFNSSSLNEQDALFDDADALWANINTPTSNFSNFDLALTAHNPTPHQLAQPAYHHADANSFAQASTSFVQQYPPATTTEEDDSSFLIRTPPPTRDASSRRRLLRPKSRSSTPSAGRPAAPRTLSSSYMPAITDASPPMQFPAQQMSIQDFPPPQMYMGPQYSPEHFRPQPIPHAPQQYFYASSAPTWHTSYEPPNPFDQDPFVSQPQFQAMNYGQPHQLMQHQPLPTSGQAASAAQQHMRAPSHTSISLSLTPAVIQPGPLPNRQMSPTRNTSTSRQRSLRKAISPPRRLATQTQLAPAAGGVDPSKLMQPRPGPPPRSQSFTAGTVVSGPYEHYHKEAQRERERMQSRLRAEGPSPLKRQRVSRGLVVDANGRASVVELS